NEEEFFITCPGRDKHTTPDADRDCKLYENPHGAPRAFCQHQSCAPEVAQLNSELAKLGNEAGAELVKLSGKKGARSATLAALAESALSEILTRFDWPASAIQARSPQPLDTPENEQWYHVLDLFDDWDVVWIGRDVYE